MVWGATAPRPGLLGGVERDSGAGRARATQNGSMEALSRPHARSTGAPSSSSASPTAAKTTGTHDAHLDLLAAKGLKVNVKAKTGATRSSCATRR